MKMLMITLIGTVAMATAAPQFQFDDNQQVPYTFAYGVNDPETGDEKEHKETVSASGAREGEFRWLQPNGLYRTTRYSADGLSGFRASVSQEPGERVANYYTNTLLGTGDIGGVSSGPLISQNQGAITSQRVQFQDNRRPQIIQSVQPQSINVGSIVSGNPSFSSGSIISGNQGFSSGSSFSGNQGFSSGSSFSGNQGFSTGSSFSGNQGFSSGSSFSGNQGTIIDGGVIDGGIIDTGIVEVGPSTGFSNTGFNRVTSTVGTVGTIPGRFGSVSNSFVNSGVSRGNPNRNVAVILASEQGQLLG